MGGRGASSASSMSSADSISLSSKKKKLVDLSQKMAEYAKFALPGQGYDEKKARQYYGYQRKFQTARRELAGQNAITSNTKKGKKKVFVNSFGDATTRYITSPVFDRDQRRTSKSVLKNMGL